MWTPSITEQAARLNARTLRLRVRRSLAKAPKRGTRAHTCYIGLPRKLWDRTILFMFSCCLCTFLRALFGFGVEGEDLHVSNVYPRTPLSAPPPWSRNSVASNEGPAKLRAQGMTRVIVDWHGNYELLPSTTFALIPPATIPQDAFPGPTPTLVRAERGRALGEGHHSTTTKVKTSVDIPFMLSENLYDPFRLEFEDSAEGGESPRLYPATGPPRIALQGVRKRRFGKCLPGEACW